MGQRTELVASVDETGPFDRPSGLLGVGGPVLRAGPGVDQELRAMLRKALPHIGFPPHAAHLNRPSFHLVRWLLIPHDRRARIPPDLAAPLHKVEQSLRHREDLPPLLRHPCAWPGVLELEQCDTWLLRNARDCYALLKDVLALVRQRVLELLRGVAKRMNGTLVAAVKLPGAGPDACLATQPDRYLQLLELYLEHLLRLYEGRESPVQITLRLSGRHVVPRVNGAPVELTNQHVEELLDRVRSRGVGAGVEVLLPAAPSPTDVYMPAELALADLVMNRLRWAVEHAPEWRHLLQLAHGDLGMPVETRVPRLNRKLPSLAFMGLASEAVRAAAAGHTVLGLNELEFLAREPTELWMAALKARGPEEEG